MSSGGGGVVCVGCSSPASLQCPKCLSLGLPPAVSSFCTQECFKNNWASHKAIHKLAKASSKENSDELADGWGYAIDRGSRRTATMPACPYPGALRPAHVGPTRSVPANVVKPDYALTGIPVSEEESRQQRIVPVRTEEEIARLRAVCRLGREVIDAAHRAVKPGVTTDEIDRVVHEVTVAGGGYPSPLNYYNFPKSCCTSVNEIICHGIPDKRPLEEGDIVNVDISVYRDGMHADLNETFVVGDNDKVSDEAKQIVLAAYQCLFKAISLVKPGVRFRDFGDAIQSVANRKGLGVTRTYCGHGIGELFHCAPNIPHYAKNKAIGAAKVGHVFTIEPMINGKSWRDVTWPDGWTASTEDGRLSAQFEHTILVTEDGYELLTGRTLESPPLWWEKSKEEGGLGLFGDLEGVMNLL